jgi:hypothetical protein
MNLFEWLFTKPAALRRQTAAPLYKQRVAFLTYLRDHDRKYHTLRAVFRLQTLGSTHFGMG